MAELEKLRHKLALRSLDEAISALIRRQRVDMISEAFGLDKGRMSSFTEEDRGEDR